MTQGKPTPTPWRFGNSDEGVRLILGGPRKRYVATVQIYQTPRAYGIADEPEREANAALIVRAINAHEAMKEALRELMHHPGSITAHEQARAALKLAETE